MFGESDSESPRVPSPWDSLASSPKHNGIYTIPKLVPEVEEGNVEYKLQLLSPTPARFARLVTQLKWRLLEGGGQAYYEIGVADSGTLVGLPRGQLEESLETLEMMAGEIGASVIVVKEIEVPPELSTLAESQLERWNGRRSTRRKDLLRMMKQETSSAAEFEAKLFSTDFTNAEESSSYSPAIPPTSPGDLTQPIPCPTPIPVDSALALFTMDVGEDFANYVDNEVPDDEVPNDSAAGLSINLEISPVYKPRPMKKRAIYVSSAPPAHFEYVKECHKIGHPLSNPTDAACHTEDSIAQDSSLTLSQTKGAKAQHRRDKRDKRQELKHDVPSTHVSTCRVTESPTDSADHQTVYLCSTDKSNPSFLESPHVDAVNFSSKSVSGTIETTFKEPRLIVEALVIRKLSLDEAFLDFEGFTL